MICKGSEESVEVSIVHLAATHVQMQQSLSHFADYEADMWHLLSEIEFWNLESQEAEFEPVFLDGVPNHFQEASILFKRNMINISQFKGEEKREYAAGS